MGPAGSPDATSAAIAHGQRGRREPEPVGHFDAIPGIWRKDRKTVQKTVEQMLSFSTLSAIGKGQRGRCEKRKPVNDADDDSPRETVEHTLSGVR